MVTGPRIVFQMPSTSSLSFSNLSQTECAPSHTERATPKERAPNVNLVSKPRHPELPGKEVKVQSGLGVSVLLVAPLENPERDVREVPEVGHHQRVPADDFPARVRNPAVVLAHGGRRCLHTAGLYPVLQEAQEFEGARLLPVGHPVPQFWRVALLFPQSHSFSQTVN